MKKRFTAIMLMLVIVFQSWGVVIAEDFGTVWVGNDYDERARVFNDFLETVPITVSYFGYIRS